MNARHFKPLGLNTLAMATLTILACGPESRPIEPQPVDDDDNTTPPPAADREGYADYDVDLTYWLPLFGIGGIMDASSGESLSSSRAILRGGTGDVVGQLVYVGLGCDQAAGSPQVLPDGQVQLRASYHAEAAGKIALIERDGCPFSVKVGLAQLAGATGVIVYNQPLDPGVPLSGDVLVQMTAYPGTFPPGAEVIDIPVAFVTHSDGLALAAAAPAKARMQEPALAGDHEVAADLPFAYRDEVVALFVDRAISLDEAITPFYAPGPFAAALELAVPAAM